MTGSPDQADRLPGVDETTPPPEESSRGEVTFVADASETSPQDERVAELIAHTIDVPVLAEAVEKQEAADAADTLEDLEDEETVDVLEAMSEQAAAEALAEMEEPLAVSVLDDLLDEGKAPLAGRLLDLMAPDDAADLLQTIDDTHREELYRTMPPDEAVKLRRLTGYAEDTAAGLMTTEYLVLRQDMTVAEATESIRSSRIPEDVHHLPVVDERRVLTGLISLRALLLSRAASCVGDLMDRSVKAIRGSLDQEEVARKFDRYDFFMMPVVDDEDRLIGIITVDDIIDIIREEQTEDVQKTVGAGAEEAVYSPIRDKFSGRFPWLVTSLFLTCGAAIVILFFERLVRDYPFVAFLMPVIAATVGNAGHQALAVTLRGIVLDEVRRERVGPLLAREAVVGLLMGAAAGLLTLLLVLAISQLTDAADWRIGLIAGAALMVSMCLGTLAGSGIPLLMRRIGADPAQSSAIFLIMITDGVGFATFLGLTFLSYEWLQLA